MLFRLVDKGNNLVKVVLDNTLFSEQNFDVFYTDDYVPQRYLFYEGAYENSTGAQPLSNWDFNINQKNIAEVFLYENGAIDSTVPIEQRLNNLVIGTGDLDSIRSASLQAENRILASNGTGAYQTIPSPILKMFENPVTVQAANPQMADNYKYTATFRLTAGTVIRGMFSATKSSSDLDVETSANMNRKISLIASN
jgi:hypothetical protein